MQENVYGGNDAQVPAKDLKTPYECLAIGMEQGGGDIDFGDEFPFKGGEVPSKSVTHGPRMNMSQRIVHESGLRGASKPVNDW